MVQKSKPPPLRRALDNLAASLLEEAGIRAPTDALDRAAFIALYREATELLAARAAALDGKGVLVAKEVALMCRSMLSNTTLREAIDCAIEFSDMLHPRAGKMSLRVDENSAVLILDTGRACPTRTSCLVDLTGLLGFLQLFGWLIGDELRVRSVLLGYPNREDGAPLLSLFGAPVFVGDATYRFEFDAAQLERPILRNPAELSEFLRTFPYDVMGDAAQTPPLRLQVRACLDAALARGQPLPAPAALADLVGASTTTLRRRLQAEGTSYNELRDRCLCEAAEHELLRDGREIEDIAERLGFSDAITFRRAFRRWTGLSPSEFRRRASA